MCKFLCIVYNTNTNDSKTIENEVFACCSNNDEVRNNSSSGGMFYELDQRFLKIGGYACAVAYTDNFDVKHKIISTVNNLRKLMKSKYIQSYNNTKSFLNRLKFKLEIASKKKRGNYDKVKRRFTYIHKRR